MRRTRSLSDLNIFKCDRNRVKYLMNQAWQTFYTNFIDENGTDHKRLFKATKQLLARKEELSFPNYQDKSKLVDDIGGFFVRKINRLRSVIDAVDIDLSAQCATSWLLAALACCCLSFHELYIFRYHAAIFLMNGKKLWLLRSLGHLA